MDLGLPAGVIGKDLAAALCGGFLRSGDRILPADAPIVNCLHNQQHRHHLGDTGRCKSGVGLLLIEHGTGGHIH